MTATDNQPISQLTQDHIKDIKIICFDTDGVTVKRGTQIEQKGQELYIKTYPLQTVMLTKLNALKKHFHITINSGRSGLYLTEMYRHLLWDNTSIISENGVFILYQGKLIQNFDFSDYELATLKTIRSELDKLAVSDSSVKGFEPKQFIISLHCSQAINQVDQIVSQNDPQKEFYCWWNGEAYDIAPRRFNKGVGLKKLSQLLGLDISQTLAVGNGVNDKDMIDVAGVSVTTDPATLSADFSITGEHLGGTKLIDQLLKLVR